MKKNNKGFSLVELIIVIAIMAVLVGVLAPQYLKYVEKSRIQADETALDEGRSAIVNSLSDADVYSTVATGAKVVFKNSTTDGISYTNGAGGSDETTLINEICSVLNSATNDKSFSLGSTAYKGSQFTFEMTYDTENMTWKVTSLNDALAAATGVSGS